MSGRAVAVALCLAALAVYLAASSIYIVNEGEQALVVRLGAPVGVVDKPGLDFKAPFIDSVYVTSTRSLLLEPPLEQVIMGDEKRLEVQPYARFRIVDPLRFYQALRTNETANAQLAQLVSSSARRELGQVPLRALLTEERGHILDVIKGEVAAKAEPLGVEVDEVRFDRSDLPFETSQAIYDRMKSERQREAKELRAQGFEWAQQIRGPRRPRSHRHPLGGSPRRGDRARRRRRRGQPDARLPPSRKTRNSIPSTARLRPTAARSPMPRRRWWSARTPTSFRSSNPAPSSRPHRRRPRRVRSLELAARRGPH